MNIVLVYVIETLENIFYCDTAFILYRSYVRYNINAFEVNLWDFEGIIPKDF